MDICIHQAHRTFWLYFMLWGCRFGIRNIVSALFGRAVGGKSKRTPFGASCEGFRFKWFARNWTFGARMIYIYINTGGMGWDLGSGGAEIARDAEQSKQMKLNWSGIVKASLIFFASFLAKYCLYHIPVHAQLNQNNSIPTDKTAYRIHNHRATKLYGFANNRIDRAVRVYLNLRPTQRQVHSVVKTANRARVPYRLRHFIWSQNCTYYTYIFPCSLRRTYIYIIIDILRIWLWICTRLNAPTLIRFAIYYYSSLRPLPRLVAFFMRYAQPLPCRTFKIYLENLI